MRSGYAGRTSRFGSSGHRRAATSRCCGRSSNGASADSVPALAPGLHLRDADFERVNECDLLLARRDPPEVLDDLRLVDRQIMNPHRRREDLHVLEQVGGKRCHRRRREIRVHCVTVLSVTHSATRMPYKRAINESADLVCRKTLTIMMDMTSEPWRVPACTTVQPRASCAG